jgi:hypothetical protein
MTAWQANPMGTLPLHPSGIGAVFGIEPFHTIGEISLSPTRPALPFFPHRPKGRACPLEPSRLRRGKGAFLLPLTHDRRAFNAPLDA